MATTSPVFSTRAASWATAAVLLLMMMTGPARAQPDRPRFPEEPVEPMRPVEPEEPDPECSSSCSQRECREKADLGELFPGVFRSADEYAAEELPEGCSLSFSEDGDDEDFGRVSCNDQSDSKFSSRFHCWIWGDGNCCCPSYRYLTCPRYIRVGNQNYQVVHWWTGHQCFTTVRCGLENGICQGKCTPIYHYRTVLVYDPRVFIRWVSYRYAAACRCTTCQGGYCKSGFILGDGIDK